MKEVTGHQSPVTSQNEEDFVKEVFDEVEAAESANEDDSEPVTGDGRPVTDSDGSGEAAEEES